MPLLIYVILGHLFVCCCFFNNIAFHCRNMPWYFSHFDGHLGCFEKLFFTNNVLMTFFMSSCALAKWTAFLKQGSFSEPQNKEGNWNNYFLTFLWKVYEKHHSRCINEKLIHFIKWCLRILGLNSLYKWLRKLLVYSLGARLLWVCTISIFLDTEDTRRALPSGYTNYTHTNNAVPWCCQQTQQSYF